MIPQETVQQILQAADVAEVVGDFVSLKKRGSNLIACCPFHNEKTPSFSVSPSKGLYKCFGCGKGGDSVRFLMDLEGLSYPEALKWLAKKYGIEIVEKEYNDEELLAQNERDSLFIVNEFAADFFAAQLGTEEGESIGLSYFKERGFTTSTIEKFKLGYSPDSWDAFTRHALKNGFKLEILEKAGLTIVREGKDPIDRFRGRVIFPIVNVAGKPVAFGARILKSDPKSPKYLNSPETDIYHKSRLVYGIFTAKNSIRQKDICYLVEGYTDVVSLGQAGIENVVASSGTSLTAEQVQLIRRFTTNITMLYDGDAAGINASLRGTDIILEEGVDVRVVVFPDGEDPDSYIRKVGGEAFEAYVKENQKDFIRFKTEHSLKKVGNDPIARASLISDLVETITKIPDAIKRAVFYSEVAQLLGIEEGILVDKGNSIIRGRIKDKNKAQPASDLPQVEQELITAREIVDNLQLTSDSNSIYEVKYRYEMELMKVVYLIACSHEKEGGLKISDQSTAIYELLTEVIEDELFTIDNPVVIEMLEIFFEHYNEFGFVNSAIYRFSTKDNIQKMAISWEMPLFTESPGWKAKEKASDTLENISLSILLKHIDRIKYEMLDIRQQLEKQKYNLNLLPEEEDEVSNRVNKLLLRRSQLGTKLGSVINAKSHY